MVSMADFRVSAEWLHLGRVRSRVRSWESSSLGFAFRANTSSVMAHVPHHLMTKGHAWTEYCCLKAAKVWKKLGDAEMMVGRMRSVLSESGFSCSELTLAVHCSEAMGCCQQIGALYSFTLILVSHLFV
jgi:hypothetical protein